jgi:hypothetical protein
MTAAALLATLWGRGVEVYVADGRLRYRGPAGALNDDLRRAAADHRAELLALVGGRDAPGGPRRSRLIRRAVGPSPVAAADAVSEGVTFSDIPTSPDWPAAAADVALRQALAIIDAALSAPWLTAAQRNVVGVFRRQVQTYHVEHDPQLFGVAGWIEAHVNRWRAPNPVHGRRK